MTQAGLVYITVQSSGDVTPPELQAWHKHSEPSQTASRSIYRARNTTTPEWLGLSDVAFESELPPRSLGSPKLDGKVYELQFSKGRGAERPARFLIALRRVFKEEKYAAEYAKWFEEEHVRLIEKIPGWQRSRTFRLRADKDAGLGNSGPTYYLTVHEYEQIGDMKETMKRTRGLSTAWKSKVDEMLEEKVMREWEFYFSTPCTVE